MSASMVQLPCVAPEVVPSHIVKRVATKVTERAEVCRLSVVDAHLVLMQFGHSPKSLVADITSVTAESCVKRLVLFQTVAPRGAEGTVSTTMGSSTFVFELDMMCHASFLLTGESTVLAMQTLRFNNSYFLFVMDMQDVTSQRHFRFGYKRAHGALDLTWL